MNHPVDNQNERKSAVVIEAEQMNKTIAKGAATALPLNTILDGSYKVYFNPFLNGERPDIVILRQSCGVLIIEVKDWHLCNYTMDNTGRWRLRIENVCKKSPIDQVKSYKENLFNLHIDKLLDRKIHDSKYFAIISCAVYFHNETEASVRNFCGNTGYIELLGHDSLTNANFQQQSILRFVL